MFRNLEAEQKRADLTNDQTAKHLNMSRATYEHKKKTGKFKMSEIIKLCKLFKCTFEYLFEISGQ